MRQMYADFSHDTVNAFLRELTEQPAEDGRAEDFSDEMILAQMELTRFKTAAREGRTFVPRTDRLSGPIRIHPADYH